jgi:hypothetical protein
MVTCNGIARPIVACSTETCSPLTETRTSTGLLVVGGDDAIGHIARFADQAETRRIFEADAAILPCRCR